MAGKTVEPTEPQGIENYDPSFHSWNDLVDTADEILGYRLIKDEDLDTLLGVPFVITRLVYRMGEATGNGHEGCYVSHECTIAPIDVLERRIKDLSKLAVEPDELVVFNDGSTGVYRQDTKYLATHGFIKLPEPVIVGGKSGESTFDLPPNKWEGVNEEKGTVKLLSSGLYEYTANVRISCPRGLRLSAYTAEGFGDAKTRYLG
jgi:hypothetical protein